MKNVLIKILVTLAYNAVIAVNYFPNALQRGIMLKNMSENGYSNAYPAIIATFILCVMLYSGTIG